MAIEFGLRLEGKTTEEITPEERETYVLKPGEVYELHFTGSQPVLSMERLKTYMDKMLALKNDHPEFALLYLGLGLDEMPDKVKLVVQTSVLPTEEVVKSQFWPAVPFVAKALAVAVAFAFAALFVKVAAPPTLEFMCLIRDTFAPESAKWEFYEEIRKTISEEIKRESKMLYDLEERKRKIESRFNEEWFPYYNPEGPPGDEFSLTQEEIQEKLEKMPPDQERIVEELVKDYKKVNEQISGKKKTLERLDIEYKKVLEDLSETPRREPHWWLIGGVLGVAGLAAATGLIRTLRKD